MSRFDARLASDLWFFVNAANSDSLAMAASSLAVTQSAVTQRIHRLEQRLGYKLFEREGRHLRLTTAGRRLAEVATRSFGRIQGAIAGLGDNAAHSTVKVSCTPSLAAEWLTPALNGFAPLHPEHPITIFAEMNSADRNRLLSENIDIAIRYGKEPPKGALVLAVIPEQVFPVASPRLAQWVEMSGHGAATLLHDATPWEDAPAYTAEWDTWLDRRDWPAGDNRQDQFFNMAQLAYRAALDGTGIALGRRLIVSRYLDSGQLVKACPHPPIEDFRYFICAGSYDQSWMARIFIEWLIGAMRRDGAVSHIASGDTKNRSARPSSSENFEVLDQ